MHHNSASVRTGLHGLCQRRDVHGVSYGIDWSTDYSVAMLLFSQVLRVQVIVVVAVAGLRCQTSFEGTATSSRCDDGLRGDSSIALKRLRPSQLLDVWRPPWVLLL